MMTPTDELLADMKLKAETNHINNLHCMIDLETWATSAAAIPIAIGAVKFDPSKGTDGVMEWGRFYVAIDPRTAHPLGLHIDPGTVMWWMDKAQRPALDHWLEQPKVAILEALDGFREWYGDKSLPTWGNGPAFDNIIVETAFKVLGQKRPWAYGHDRDFRSIRGLLHKDWRPPVDSDATVMAHDALSDAVGQTWELLSVAEALGLVLR